RDDELWALAGDLGRDLGGFIQAVAEKWQADSTAAPPADPKERAEIDRICALAEQSTRAGDHERARNILAAAVARNDRARSPLPFQYLANLGVITSDLFVAVTSQKEALRLAPENPLYRENLVRLLAVPYPKGQLSGRRVPYLEAMR
ncbi:MAG: hypothetical protein ACREQQ_12230, partial [Candidatus Binatia bacterium]